jgi:hypothetical protein
MDKPPIPPASSTPRTDATDFLFLPLEIRQMVYTHLFRGYRLIIDEPVSRAFDRNRRHEACRHRTFEKPKHRASVPPMLVVCKSVRAEATPVFAQQLEAYFYRLSKLDALRSHHLAPYLSSTRKAFCDTGFLAGPRINIMTLMPKLRKIITTIDLILDHMSMLDFALQNKLRKPKEGSDDPSWQQQWDELERDVCERVRKRLKLHRLKSPSYWLNKLAAEQEHNTEARDLPIQLLVVPDGYFSFCSVHTWRPLTVSFCRLALWISTTRCLILDR